MKRLKSWKRVLAFLLVFVLILQGAGADAITMGADSTGETSAGSGGRVSGKVMQQLLVQNNKNYIRYTITLKNENTQEEAADVNVKVLLPKLVSYEKTMGYTEGIRDYESQAAALKEQNLDEFDEATLRKYEDGSVVMWTDLTLSAGEEKELLFFGAVELGALTTVELECVCYTGTEQAENFWKDADNLIKGVKSTETETEATTEVAGTNNGGSSENATENEEDTQSVSSSVVKTVKSAMSMLRSAAANLLGEGDEGSTSFSDYIDSVELVTSDGNGYDPSNPTANNGWVTMEMTFSEISGGRQFPVGSELTYDMTDGGKIPLKGFTAESGEINDSNGLTDESKNIISYGTYSISADGIITITFNENVNKYYNLAGKLVFAAQFDKSKIEVGKETIITFPGEDTGKTLYFKEGTIVTAKKTASSYDPERGGFTFTITVKADEGGQNIYIKDILESNLELKYDSENDFQVSPSIDYGINKLDNGFEFRSKNTLEQDKEYTITYFAKLKNVENYNGKVDKIGNRIILSANDGDEVTIDGPASYTHVWVEKSNSGLTDGGKISWTLTANPDADQPMKDVEIGDTLKTEGMDYDTFTPIQVVQTDREGNRKEYTLDWSDVSLASDGKSWTYKVEPGEGDSDDCMYSYQFTYLTTLESSETGKTYTNTGKVGNFSADSSVTLSTEEIGDGTGSGSGVGVDKKYKDIVIDKDTNTKYILWESTITLPKGANHNVYYEDALIGSQQFVTPLSIGTPLSSGEYNKISVVGFPGNVDNIGLTSGEKSFKLQFGDINSTTETKITITYYSQVIDEGTAGNIGRITTNGKTISSTESTSTYDYSFAKNGSYNSSTRELTWTVVLQNEDGHNLGAGSYLVVTDTFSENQEYVESSALINGKYGNNIEETVNNNQVIFKIDGDLIELLNGKRIELTYKTTLKDQGEFYDKISTTNKAVVSREGRNLGETNATYEIASNVLDKKVVTSPDSENGYTATYSVDINKTGAQLLPDGATDKTFVIKDSIEENMDYLVSSLVLKQDGTVMDSANYNALFKGKNLTITIPDGDGHSYQLSYQVSIHKKTTSPEETVPFNNTVSFEVNGKTYQDVEREEVVIKQSSSSGATGSKIYFKVYKYDRQRNAPMAGVTFALYKVNGTTDTLEGAELIGNATTKDAGYIIIGQEPETGAEKGYPRIDVDGGLSVGTRYALVETKTKDGYLLNSTPYYFTFGNNISSFGQKEFANDQKTKVIASKVWDDGNNQDGIRPNSIQLTLYENGVISTRDDVHQTLTVNSDGTTSPERVEWDGLRKYDDNGKLIKYTVKETSELPEGYESSVEVKPDENYDCTVTNKHIPETVDIKVTKTWDDGDNQDGIRPSNVYVQLYKTVDSIETAVGDPVNVGTDSKWSHTWESMPKYETGKLITYSVKEGILNESGQFVEAEINGYEKEISTEDHKSFNITNTHIPATVSKTVNKYWSKDLTSTNDDGNRPASVKVQLNQSYTDNTGKKNTKNYDSVTLNDQNNWTYTWNDLPKYVRVSDNSYEATYTVVEESVSQYDTTYYNNDSATDDSVTADGTTGSSVSIKNSYHPEKISVKAQKAWKDNSNADKKRPESITLALEKKSFDQTDWTEVSEKTISKNSGDTENNQSWSETAVWSNLLKYENGYQVYYRVVEKNGPSGYTVSYNVNSFDATTVATGGTRDIIVTNTHGAKTTVQFSAKKILAGNRSESLQAGEFNFVLKDSSGLIRNATNEADGSVTFSPDLEFTQEGTYNYSISEVGGSDPDPNIQYSSEVYAVSVTVTMDDNGQLQAVPTITKNGIQVDGFNNVTFTNTYQASGSGSVTGSKTLIGKTLSGGEFTFGLFESETAAEPIAIATNDKNGNFNITTPTYTQNDIGTPKIYYLKEIVDSQKTKIYDYDSTVYTVEVGISDKGNGQLNVVTSIKNSKDSSVPAVFTNSYKATGSLDLSATKTVTGRPDVPDDFEFELYQLNNMGDDISSGKLLQTAKNSKSDNGNAGIAFESISYGTENIGKTYYYAVKEKLGDNKAYTYDSTVYIVKAVIEDAGNGQIKVTPTYYKNSVAEQNKVTGMTFNNDYNATGEITLTGKKSLLGKTLVANQFWFTLYELTTDGENTQEHQIESAVTNDENGNITFPTLTYTQDEIGIHHYRIREINGGKSGYTYANPVDVVVTVTASDTNVLNVTSNRNGDSDSAGKGGITFSNSYAASTKVNLIAKKVLNGRDLADKQFTFTLTGDGNNNNTVSQRKTNAEDGTITFDPLSFTQQDIGKIYHYTLKEEIPETQAAGYTYDETEYPVTIEITDENDNGTLTATVTIDGKSYDPKNPPTFTNTYEASGKITLEGKKFITGKSLEAGEFAFILTDEDGNPVKDQEGNDIESVSNDADGNFAFETIHYNQDQVGEHVYFIKEAIPNPKVNGYTYDETTFRVTVQVSDNGDRTLTPSIKEICPIRGDKVGSAVEEVLFTNKYNAEGSVTLEACKSLERRVLKENQFNFILYDSDNNTVLQTKQNNSAGKVIFESISYDETKLGKHIYYIKEEDTNEAGYTYATDVYQATVTVEDNNHNGKLTTSVSYAKLDANTNQYNTIEGVPEFTNTYSATGNITLSGEKKLTGNKALEKDQFTFILTDEQGEELDRVKNNVDGNFSFQLNYDQDDVIGAGEDGKDFTYYVKEEIPENAENDPYDYDQKAYKVVINVTDNSDGTLSVTQKSLTVNNENKEKVAFTNHYNAKGSLPLSVKKQTNISLTNLQENTFSFSLAGSGINQTKTSDPKTGKVNFDAIEYTEEDINADYVYTIREIRGKNAGYEYSNEIYLIKAHISDNGDGTLKVETNITDSFNKEVDSSKMVFSNIYSATGSLKLEAEKTLAGRALEEGQFTFTLTGGDSQKEEEEVSQTKTNNKNGNVAFDEIKYDQDDIGKTFTYTVSEVNDKKSGYGYSDEVYTVTVNVADGGNGKLDVTPVIKNKANEVVDTMTFANTYAATGEINLTANKTLAADLTEKQLEEGQYTFTVTENGEKVAEATNDKDGKITFPEIDYAIDEKDQSALGTHSYVISEATGDDLAAIYDTSKYTVTVEVSDNGDGTLKAEITEIAKDGKAIESMKENSDQVQNPVQFVNDFSRISLSKKTLTGEDELPGATLQVIDKDGNIIDEWVSGNEPHILEGVLAIGETYTLKEQAPPDGYQYAADIEFTVKEDGRDNITMVDAAKEESLGIINVTKKVAKLENFDFVDLVTDDAIFYVGLFTDEEGKHPYGNDYIRAIHIQKASVSEPVQYTDLPTGTYYVLETDQAGNPIPLNEAQLSAGGQHFVCQVEDGTTNQVTLDINNAKKSGKVNLVNAYYELPEGYAYKADISITKSVLYKGAATTVSDTFHAGIFTRDDAGQYQLYNEVELKQNDTVNVEVPLGGEDGTEAITYYVFETDGNGNMINKDSFAYEVSGEGEVTVSKEATSGSITITNTVSQNKGQFTLLKVDENGEALSGAEFSIANTDGTVIGTWTSAETAQSFVLEPGTYIVTETSAPEGYVKGGPVTVIVNEDGIVSVSGSDATLNDSEITYVNIPEDEEETEVENGGSGGTTGKNNSSSSVTGGAKGSTSAKTGDDNPVGFYLILLLGASAVAVTLSVRRRRRG